MQSQIPAKELNSPYRSGVSICRLSNLWLVDDTFLIIEIFLSGNRCYDRIVSETMHTEGLTT